MKKRTFKHVFGSALLITGTSVGAGLLALPLATAEGGFFPALAVFILSWFVMTVSGFFYFELCQAMGKETNIISLSEKYLGKGGKGFAWVIYLFLFYCLLVAYISGGAGFFSSLYNFQGPGIFSVILFTLVFSIFVYFGAKVVDRVNILLMAGLVVSYITFVIVGVPHINGQNLMQTNWVKSIPALPITLIAFGYQGLIPTLTNYLHRDERKVKTAIIIGTTLTLIINVFWQLLVLGMVPMQELLRVKAENIVTIFPQYEGAHTSIGYVAHFFSFFAITTSFVGVSLAIYDFLSDGLKWPKKGTNKLKLAAITFLPPLIITLIHPKIFLLALNYAGGIGGVILLAFLPALMLYKKNLHLPHANRMKKNILIYIVFLYVIFELIVEIYNEYSRIVN